ncbi:YeeE/YedE family protein [Brevirhabdus sp.]|uniref:YeeE/YedE family protein n=1 Tax=Brevirhabdus sp. TaxID=2004514 RepID=UPI004058838E
MTEFTPYLSLAGGALIGLSAVLLMALNGRIAGISGITSRLLEGSLGGKSQRPGLFFLIGLLISAPVWLLTTGSWPEQAVPGNLALMAVAGLLVGFGAVFGNGCTSGHGVCGISRGSGRSIVATLTFMLTAAVTVFVARHIIGA